MSWLKEWIMQIAGIIAIGAICDMVMIDGVMKKYIKPVLGFVLIAAVIKPLVGFSGKSIDIVLPQSYGAEAAKFSEGLEKVERDALINLYEKKLIQKVKDELKEVYPGRAEVNVITNTDSQAFGSIKMIQISIFEAVSETLDTKSIAAFISEKFGLSQDAVKLILNTE